MSDTWPDLPATRDMDDLDAWMNVELLPNVGPSGFDEEIVAIQLTLATIGGGTREGLALRSAHGDVTPGARYFAYQAMLADVHEAASVRQFRSPGTLISVESIINDLRKLRNPWQGARRPENVPYRADGAWWVDAWWKALLDAVARAVPIPDEFLHPAVHLADLEAHRASDAHKVEVIHVDVDRHRTLHGCIACGTWISDPESINERRGEMSFWRARDEYPSWLPSLP